jgi:signal transduction histidine kinase/ligand-binding sensor domain-containing protein
MPPPNLHQWGAVTLFHGLPSDRVRAIAQTPDGVMWFGTDGGLAKYDGRRTQAITGDGLPPGKVLALKLDPDGALWIGTEGGATRFAQGRFEFIKETEGKVITAIISPQRGHAFISSESGVVFDCQIKPAGGFTIRLLPDQPLQSADKDQPGTLKITSLALAHDVLYAGTQSRGILTIENGVAKNQSDKPPGYFVNALETDARGHLWAGAKTRPEDSGLFDYNDPLKPAKASVPTGPVTAITRGAGQDIWVACDGHGAFHLQDGKELEHFGFEATAGALRSDHVFAIFVDSEKVVWFGTDKGVCRYDPHAPRTENISQDPATNYVRALWRTSRGQLLAGTNAGLFLYEDAAKRWRQAPELARRIVYAIGEDKNGRVIIATANGLFAGQSANKDLTFARIAPQGQLPQGDSVRAIANLDGATFLATYGYGVEKLEGTQRTLVWPEESADDREREVVSLGADSNGHLLIGTASAGLFFFDGKQTTAENALDRLKGEAIWSVVADNGSLWLATGRGLYIYQAGQLKEVVPGVSARRVVLSADTARAREVWCATVGSGVLKVLLDDQFGAIVSRMDPEQGLPSGLVFAILPEHAGRDGESVIIGTNRGVVRYEPGSMRPPLSPARIISKRIHQPEELTSGLQLDYPQNSLLLDVAATSSRTFPEQFQYGFSLFDAAGHVIKERLSRETQFPMEGLKPGRYKVVARAFTKDLVASEPLSFQFNVAGAPFPWTTTALAVLLTLALIALWWGYLQNRRIHRTSAALASANRELADARLQLANETEAERRRIARDLHDQTLADLRKLALLVDQLPPTGSDGELFRPNRAPSAPSMLRREIEVISQEVRRICEDLSPSALENVGLAAALHFALAHAVESAAPECKFEYKFDCDDSLDDRLKLSPSAQIQIYRIVQEVLSNICRHSGPTRVEMTANVTAQHDFEIRIEDNGRAFDGNAAGNKPGRGIASIHARTSIIGAEVSWTKRQGGGTVFALRLARTGAVAVPPSA